MCMVDMICIRQQLSDALRVDMKEAKAAMLIMLVMLERVYAVGSVCMVDMIWLCVLVVVQFSHTHSAEKCGCDRGCCAPTAYFLQPGWATNISVLFMCKKRFVLSACRLGR